MVVCLESESFPQGEEGDSIYLTWSLHMLLSSLPRCIMQGLKNTLQTRYILSRELQKFLGSVICPSISFAMLSYSDLRSNTVSHLSIIGTVFLCKGAHRLKWQITNDARVFAKLILSSNVFLHPKYTILIGSATLFVLSGYQRGREQLFNILVSYWSLAARSDVTYHRS